nr:Transcriptional regulatory protein CusR [Klebsiella pneumoniae]
MKILIVEDEKKTGEYLTKGLTEAGFVVDRPITASTAITGDDQRLRSADPRHHAAGCEWLGYRAHAAHRRKGMPILLLTALGTIEHRVKGLELGADDYLVKPFAFAELLARVRTLLRRGRRSSSKASFRRPISASIWSAAR